MRAGENRVFRLLLNHLLKRSGKGLEPKDRRDIPENLMSRQATNSIHMKPVPTAAGTWANPLSATSGRLLISPRRISLLPSTPFLKDGVLIAGKESLRNSSLMMP